MLVLYLTAYINIFKNWNLNPKLLMYLLIYLQIESINKVISFLIYIIKQQIINNSLYSFVQSMQILRQALFQKLNSNILHFQIVRNKIVCITQNQLIVLSIDISNKNKKTSIPLNGSMIRSFSLSKDYICLLQWTGSLTVRKVQNIKDVIFSCQNIKIVNSYYPHLKWWQDQLHLIYQTYYEEINLYFQIKSKKTLPFQLKKQEKLIDIEFCDLFIGIKNILYQLENCIYLCLNGICLGKLYFKQSIKQILRLCHPFQQEQFNKQYLVVIENDNEKQKHKLKLKVFNIINMKMIFQTDIFCGNGQFIKIQTDDLNEYLLIKSFDKHTKQIENIDLLKINKDFYYSSDIQFEDDSQSFFMFDIEIGLKQNLHLFPSHSQIIKNKLCNSIDSCYCQKNQVFIASVVVEASYKDQIYMKKQNFINPLLQKQKQNTDDDNYYSRHGSEIILWRQIVWTKMNPKLLVQKIIKKFNTLNQININKGKSYCCIDIGLEQQFIIQNILNNLKKCHQFNSNFNENSYQSIKQLLYVEYFPMLTDIMSIQQQQSRTQRQILEKSSEDAINTMSGSSSPAQQSPRSNQTTIQDCQKQKQNRKANQDYLHNNSPSQNILNQLNNNINNNDQNQIENAKNIHSDEQLQCQDCQNIEKQEACWHYIENQISSQWDEVSNKILKFDQSLSRMETIGKHKTEMIQRCLKQINKSDSTLTHNIQQQFNKTLQTISKNVSSRLETVSIKFKQKSHCDVAFRREAKQFCREGEEMIEYFQLKYKEHKKQNDQLLDLLYDIEFGQEDDGEDQQGAILNINIMKKLGEFGNENDDSFRIFSGLSSNIKYPTGIDK